MSWEYNQYLAHFGIFGMKWGVRRYQNEDGTLTEEGKRRYQNSDGSLNEEGKKMYSEQLTKDIEKKWVNVHNNVSARSREEFAKVNNNSKYKDHYMDFEHPGKIEKMYLKDIAKVDNRLFEEECQKMFGNNPLWKKEMIAFIPTAHQFDRMLAKIEERERQTKK